MAAQTHEILYDTTHRLAGTSHRVAPHRMPRQSHH
jgi:hypothetical protein